MCCLARNNATTERSFERRAFRRDWVFYRNSCFRVETKISHVFGKKYWFTGGSVIRRRMDFQSVRKMTDWKSILHFANPHIVSGQLLRPIHTVNSNRTRRADAQPLAEIATKKQLPIEEAA